jgi:electron transport complex protein RnfE
MNKVENLFKGVWKENPIFVSLLGLCSTLAITTKVENAIGMGVAFTFVLIVSNILISLVRNIVPDEIRIPVYIVIVATIVTAVENIMEAFVPGVYNSLGIFIPLIVVNCIILGRAEAYARYNGVGNSILDAIGMSLGYTGVLLLLAIIREIMAYGTITIWAPSGLIINFNELIFGLAEGKTFVLFSEDFFANAYASFILLGVFIGLATLINTRIRNKHEKKEETK